ncbi:MAG: HlyC/CorC family transporter [Lachnospiraceae bacterium]|nr:HlyC/CorC family transporter [Lachnospiraceae bacterium]
MDSGDIMQLVILLFLLLLSAFFSSAETALTTANIIRIHSLAEDGNRRASITEKILNNSPKMLSAVLIGNNIVNISASSLATIFAQHMFGNYAVSIATGILTILVLIFGEIIPKTLATMFSEKLALIYSPVIYALMWLLTPAIFVINQISQFLLLLLHIDMSKRGAIITETELRTMVDVSHKEGIIETEERKMINNVFDFGDAEAKDVMVPRIDMAMADVNSSFNDLLELFQKERFTRIPIYENSTDNVIGIINMKDLLLYDKKEDFNVRNFLRKAFYTYESKKLSELMREMKKTSVNIIIVLDEYGVTVGLITIEDLLEEIVGDIRDEYDAEEEEEFKKISDTEYLIEGQMKIDDLNDHLNLNLSSENYDSVGGIIIENLDRIPAAGDSILLDNIRLTVQKLDNKRIDKVNVKILTEKAEEA